MKKNVIITRSYEENLILSEKIKKLNLNPIFSPMISHTIASFDFAEFRDYTDLIITSKFAAQIISEYYPHKVNAWVVGEESRDIMQKNVNINVANTYDTVLALIASLESKQNKFLYLAGNYISQNIDFADKKVIYTTEYASILSDDVIEIIQNDKADFLMFYSKNSAVNFIDLVKRYKHLQNLKNSVVIAISKEVGDVLKGYVNQILYPKSPNADQMLELLY
jgi:uroporphyrinogen-III synthase